MKRLGVVAVFQILGWWLLTALSKGLPPSWLACFNHITFHRFTPEILRMGHGFAYDVPNRDMPTVAFIGISGVLFVLMYYAFGTLKQTLATRADLWIIFGTAVLIRLLAAAGEPIHENDIYRYVWDGKTSLAGINPYKYAPSDLWMYELGLTEDYYDPNWQVTYRAREWTAEEAAQVKILLQLRDDNPVSFARIGHQQVPTIYPPVAQAVFSLAVALFGDSLLGMKCVFVLFDIGVIVLIIRLLQHLGLDPRRTLLYAWSPLVIKEYANSGHYDPVPIFFMLLALVALLKAKRSWGMLALAASTLAKFFPLALTPMLARRVRIKHVLLFTGMIGAVYSAVCFWDQTGVDGVFSGLMTYNREWFYNAGLFAGLYALLDACAPAWTESLLIPKLIMGLFYIYFIGFMACRPRHDDQALVSRCFLAVGTLFLVSPVGDPWYYGWTMPFLCVFPRRSWILLSGTLMLSYLNFRPDLSFTQHTFLTIPILNWIIYFPFFVLLIVEQGRREKGPQA